MIPIVAALAEAGLSLIGNAVLAKGKEVVEEKLGIDIESALGSDEGKLKLKQAEFDHDEFLLTHAKEMRELELEADQAGQAEVTKRWQADMLSDSWLSKNVRPLTLVWLTVWLTIMAFFSQWLKVDPVFIELMKVSYGLVLTAYFMGRTYEKHVDMKERGKPK